MVLDSDWRVHSYKDTVDQRRAQTYGQLQRVSTKFQQRRMRLISFVDTLRKDTVLECVNEISGLMTNRCLWRTANDPRTLQPTQVN